MTTFALVHGGMHGAWCWQHLTQALEERGHSTVTMDLPVSDPVGAEAYAEAVLKAVDHVKEDLVVVGHSLMGTIIPLVATARPVDAMVFLCALIPEPGRAVIDISVEQLDFPGSRLDGAMQSVDEEGRLIAADLDAAQAMFYSDCPREVAEWAYPQLRPQNMVPMSEPSPLKGWPATRSPVVVCEEDPLAPADWVAHRARKHLGVDAVRLPGGHSPFLSQPDSVAELLVSWAT